MEHLHCSGGIDREDKDSFPEELIFHSEASRYKQVALGRSMEGYQREPTARTKSPQQEPSDVFKQRKCKHDYNGW